MGSTATMELPKNFDPFDFKSSGLHGKIYGGLFLVICLLIGMLFWQGHQTNETLSMTNSLLQGLEASQRGFNSTVHDLAQAVRDIGR
jgi:hypothetical protein